MLLSFRTYLLITSGDKVFFKDILVGYIRKIYRYRADELILQYFDINEGMLSTIKLCESIDQILSGEIHISRHIMERYVDDA